MFDVSEAILVWSSVRVVVGVLDSEHGVKADQTFCGECWGLSVVELAKLGDPLGLDRTEDVEMKVGKLRHLWIP